MKIRYVLILTILLGNMFGCEVNTQEKSQTDQNQTNQKDVAPTESKPLQLKLKLNNENMGMTDNTSSLSEKLKTIFKEREDNGVFKQGSNEIEKTMYLGGDRSVSAEEIAKLFGVLKKSGASPILFPAPAPDDMEIKPTPLNLYLHIGSGESPRFFDFGIEINFVGELSENSENVSQDENPIMFVVSKNGTFTMDGKQISESELKKAIENRLKTTEKDKKIIFVEAENYGNIEDAVSIAASAGVGKVYFITKNINHKENDVSFSLSPALFKDIDDEQPSDDVRFGGPDSSFTITKPEELLDKERVEGEINFEYKNRKEQFPNAEVSKTDIDGSSGVLTIRNDEQGYGAMWLGFREKANKYQPFLISFSCQREASNYCNSEFLQIRKSIKFN